MYSPSYFQAKDKKEALDFVEAYPFATFVSSLEGALEISHLPLTLIKRGEEFFLAGHFSRANLHWKILESAQSVAIFHGPHGYISPEWYEQGDVPTWNYMVAHLRGQIRLIEDYEGIVESLKLLTHHSESLWPSGWDFKVPDDLRKSNLLCRAIVAFEMKVETIEFKKKLNQNRTLADRLGVIEKLQKRGDSLSQMLAEEMKKIV